MKQIASLWLLILLAGFTGCSHKSADTVGVKRAATQIAGGAAGVSPSAKQDVPLNIERKLIKEGYVEFETADLEKTRKTVFEAVKKYKGYVSSDREYKSMGRIGNTVVIRVPAADFDKLLNEATRGVEKFDSKQINVKDVTEEFVDIQARIKTKKALEQRYEELLKKAKTVTEILNIEREMGKLRADIESIEGRLKYLQNKVSYATLTLEFYQLIPHQSGWGMKFKNAFKQGWNNFIGFFVALVNLWPFILMGLLLIWGIRAYRRKR